MLFSDFLKHFQIYPIILRRTDWSKDYCFLDIKSPAEAEPKRLFSSNELSHFYITSSYASIEYCSSIFPCVAHNRAKTNLYPLIIKTAVLLPALTVKGV